MNKMGTLGILILIVLAIVEFVRQMPMEKNEQEIPRQETSRINTKVISYISYSKVEAEQFVKQLDELGYFKYADSSDIDNLKKNMLDNHYPNNYLINIWNNTRIPKDFRFYYPFFVYNGYSKDRITELLNGLKPTFEKLNFKCDVTNHFEKWYDYGRLNHRITINGTEYVICDYPIGMLHDMQISKRIIQILNAELAKQGKDEKIYLLLEDEEYGKLIFLTDELYKYILYRNPEWKLFELREWAKVAGLYQ